jgi:hypothetical protein
MSNLDSLLRSLVLMRKGFRLIGICGRPRAQTWRRSEVSEFEELFTVLSTSTAANGKRKSKGFDPKLDRPYLNSSPGVFPATWMFPVRIPVRKSSGR